MTTAFLLAAVLTIAGGTADAAPLDPGAAMATAPEPAVHTTALAQSAAGQPKLRVSYGRRDADGCRRLVVWRGAKRVLRIPSHVAGCSRTLQQVHVGRRLYFDWSVRKTSGGTGAEVARRRIDVWVTDGTPGGTRKVSTLRRIAGQARVECDASWARAGSLAIAGAEWCWSGQRAWVSSKVDIILDGVTVRQLPIPRMHDFTLAGRRIVTTGEDGHGRELWVHDGRMTRVDVRPGPQGSNPRRLEDRGSRVRFVANDGTGRAIWVSDGTVAGTHKVGPLP